MTTLYTQEVQKGILAASTFTVENATFCRDNGDTETVSGTVEMFANGAHEVLISAKDILRLKMSFAEFEEASNAMSRCAMGIINLTQHQATKEQKSAGVVEPADKENVSALLTFDDITSTEERQQRAIAIADIAVKSGCRAAMIGGAPFFMAPLEKALLAVGIIPLYAFSVRESKEEPDGSGGVRKINIFKHSGFVEAAGGELLDYALIPPMV